MGGTGDTCLIRSLLVTQSSAKNAPKRYFHSKNLKIFLGGAVPLRKLFPRAEETHLSILTP